MNLEDWVDRALVFFVCSIGVAIICVAIAFLVIACKVNP